MKAIVCTKYGSPDVLQLKDIEKPTPKDNEVLVKTYATTVTAGDVRMRGFKVPASFWFPARLALGLRGPRNKILGMEISREIESIGREVKQFEKGDEVFGIPEFGGGYAEYICLPEIELPKKENREETPFSFSLANGRINKELRTSTSTSLLIHPSLQSISLTSMKIA